MVIMMIAVVGQYYSVRLHAIQMLCADQMECKQCCKEELERAEHSREKIKINLNSRNRHLFFSIGSNSCACSILLRSSSGYLQPCASLLYHRSSCAPPSLQ